MTKRAREGFIALGAAAVLIVLLAGFGLWNRAHDKLESVTSAPAATKPAPDVKPKPDVKADNARFTICKTKLKKAQRLDLLYDLKETIPPTVVVGPTYEQIPFDAREGFAESVNCFLVAGSDGFINFDLLDYRTHAVVGRWEYGHLQPAD